MSFAHLAAVIAVALCSAALFVVSRGKWSDAIIDSGREWIVPDALARGDLLYRDVVYWFGPFTPYLHAAAFRLFGSNFATLVAAGAAASAAILAALFGALSSVANRRQAAVWTALAVPALVFMPHAGGAFCGMGYRIWHAAGFGLAAIVFAGRRSGRPLLSALAAGCFAGLSGLCRTEWGLAACGAVLLASALSTRSVAAFRAEALSALAGWASVFGGGLGVFLFLAGPDAVVRDGHVLLTGIPPETREFLLRFSGLRDWPGGLAQMAYSFAMWLGLVTAIELLAVGVRDSGGRRRLARLALCLAALAVAAAVGGASGAILFSAAPLVCAAALVAGVLRAPRPRAARLAALGFLGLVLSYRRPFHIGDSAYVAPPLLIAFACAGALLAFEAARQRSVTARRRVRVAFSAAGIVFAAAAFAGRFGQYAADERVPVRGTQAMLSALPEEARRIEAAAAMVRQGTPEGSGLVCLPEGEVVNFLSSRRNPIRHKLYIPGYLTAENEAEVLSELEKRPPAAILIWNRPMGEYGRGLFAAEPDGPLARWLAENYDRRAVGTPGARTFVGFRRGAVRP